MSKMMGAILPQARPWPGSGADEGDYHMRQRYPLHLQGACRERAGGLYPRDDCRP